MITITKSPWWCVGCGDMSDDNLIIEARTDYIGKHKFESFSRMSLCGKCWLELVEKLREEA